MTLLETERLTLRKLTTDDAPFLLKLLNEPSFIQNIGDRNVRTIEDACNYALNGPIASYELHGFGLYLVELKETREPIGISGLVKRDSLPDADIGFAFLPDFWRRGYAVESALAVRQYALDVLGLERFLAIVNPANAGSIRVLEKIGLGYDRMIRVTPDAPEICLYSVDFEQPAKQLKI
jgi:RimJ/RimL family protein N-acetyltransferase